jgi:hypothetical protein
MGAFAQIGKEKGDPIRAILVLYVFVGMGIGTPICDMPSSTTTI